MFGMVDGNVETVKMIGRRNINMDANMKALFYESDRTSYYTINGEDYSYTVEESYYPYFNDAKELFII